MEAKMYIKKNNDNTYSAVIEHDAGLYNEKLKGYKMSTYIPSFTYSEDIEKIADTEVSDIDIEFVDSLDSKMPANKQWLDDMAVCDG